MVYYKQENLIPNIIADKTDYTNKRLEIIANQELNIATDKTIHTSK